MVKKSRSSPLWGVACLGAASTTVALAQSAVTGQATIWPFFNAAKDLRVDVVMLGDSNQVFQLTGWDHGWQKALHEHYGIFATGLMPCGENLGFTMGLGYGYQTFYTQPSGQFSYQGAPPPLDSYMRAGIGLNPQTYLYVPEGALVPAFINEGLILEASQPIDVNESLRFHAAFGTFDTADEGSFRLAVRNQSGPFAVLATGPQILTHTGIAEARTAWLDLPAGQRDHALNFRFVPSDGPEAQSIDGPFIGYFTRAEMVDRTVGASAHSLYALGSQSARDAAESLNLAADEQLSLYFGLIRDLQQSKKHVLVRINFGINDRNEQLASVGPKMILPGFAPEAFADNVQAIINRLTWIWTVNSWPLDELYFVLVPAHVIAQPEDPQLMAYRDIAELLALDNPRTAALRYESLTSYAECQAQAWYVNPGDSAHLSMKGYEALSQRELSALTRCPADLDSSGSIDIDDYIAFQTYFVLQAPVADFDDSGTLNIDDWITFQTFFVLGC